MKLKEFRKPTKEEVKEIGKKVLKGALIGVGVAEIGWKLYEAVMFGNSDYACNVLEENDAIKMTFTPVDRFDKQHPKLADKYVWSGEVRNELLDSIINLVVPETKTEN